MKHARVALVLASLAACGSPPAPTAGPPHVEIPVAKTDAPAATHIEREAPPSSSAAKASPFPKVARANLANGLAIAVVEAHALPIVQLRVLVHAGTAYGSAPGVASLTAAMLKDGGSGAMTSAALLQKIESLGADLHAHADFDGAEISLAVTKDHLTEAMHLLGEVVTAPRFDDTEFKKLKSRETDEAEDNARSNGTWTATRIMFRELYPASSAYATYGLVPSEIAKVTPLALRDFYKRFYVPKNAEIVLAGDLDANEAKALVEKNFGAWRGGDPPKVTFAEPIAPTKRRVFVADRPKSVQSSILVVTLAPERRAKEWPDMRIANQVLGGGVASRLFSDVREKRSLAYSASSRIVELAHGAEPLLAYAGTQTNKTDQAVAGVLENIEKMAHEAITPAETAMATRYVSDIFAIRMETIGAIADLVVDQDALGLPDGYWDSYRAAIREVDATHATDAAHARFDAEHVIVIVAGDADVIAPSLARFGDVTVVDPEHEFQTLRTLPMTPPTQPKAAP